MRVASKLFGLIGSAVLTFIDTSKQISIQANRQCKQSIYIYIDRRYMIKTTMFPHKKKLLKVIAMFFGYN